MVEILLLFAGVKGKSDSLWSLAIQAGSPNTQTDHAYFMAQGYYKHKGLLSFDLTYQETSVTKRRVKSIFQGVDYQNKETEQGSKKFELVPTAALST